MDTAEPHAVDVVWSQCRCTFLIPSPRQSSPLHLLRIADYYRIPAREVFRDYQEFKVLSTFFHVVASPIVSGFKASLDETLAGYGRASERRRDNADRVGSIGEVGGYSDNRRPRGLVGGAVEKIEHTAKTYPARKATIERLDVLVHALGKAFPGQLSNEVDRQTVPPLLPPTQRRPALNEALGMLPPNKSFLNHSSRIFQPAVSVGRLGAVRERNRRIFSTSDGTRHLGE